MTGRGEADMGGIVVGVGVGRDSWGSVIGRHLGVGSAGPRPACRCFPPGPPKFTARTIKKA